jgi:hypothetical protein
MQKPAMGSNCEITTRCIEEVGERFNSLHTVGTTSWNTSGHQMNDAHKWVAGPPKRKSDVKYNGIGPAVLPSQRDTLVSSNVQFCCTQSKQQPLCRYRMQHQDEAFRCGNRNKTRSCSKGDISSLPVPVFFLFSVRTNGFSERQMSLAIGQIRVIIGQVGQELDL